MRRKLFGSGSPAWYNLDLESGTCGVIDNQEQVDGFLRKLTEALPLSALATSALMAILREQSSTANITLSGKVTKVIYAGAEGGVICHLALDEEDKEEVFLVSIIHLAFDHRLPIARKIAAYQKQSSTSDATVRPTLPPPTTSGRWSLQPKRPKHPVQYTNE